MCHADDTPMPASYEGMTLGDHQVLQCRSMDALKTWTKQGERDACFKMIDEFRQPAHTLEKYQFCDQENPYYDTMTAYFDEHGHKPVFNDDDDVDEDTS